MHDFWPACGFARLTRNGNGWLVPTDAYLRLLLQRPELALVSESCRAERALHRALQQEPARAVKPAELAAIRDADARQNYRHVLTLRDALQTAGTLEAWYLKLFRGAPIETPPLLIDLVAQAIVRNLLDDSTEALEVRAAELLFRAQRVVLQQGRVLAGDRDTLDVQNETQGFGEIGRLLAQAAAPLKSLNLRVLGGERGDERGDEEAPRFWAEATRPEARSSFLIDLTHEITRDVGHGLMFTTTQARSGLKALAGVLRKWVQHLLGVAVQIQPLQHITDAQWRWHVGLDAQASALLNDLYEGIEVDAERMRRLVSLFRLDFVNPAEMRRDVAGKPVYLGLMTNPEQVLRLKPQNLLLNLPLAAAS